MTRAAAALALMSAAASVSLAGQGAIFSASVENVRVDVLVSDGRQPLLGLQSSDFTVTDNGVLQQVDFTTFEQTPLDVVLALDLSASVTGERLAELRAAARAAVEALKADDHVGLVTFNEAVWLRTPLIQDGRRVLSMLDQPAKAGYTALVDAGFSGLVTSESGTGRALLIMFSDGLDTASFLPEATVLETAKRSDVVVYSVEVSGAARSKFLRDFSEFTGGRVLDVVSTRKLGETFVSILDEFRQRYLLSYTPHGVAKPGWHQLDVRVKNRRATVKARPGTWPDRSIPC